MPSLAFWWRQEYLSYGCRCSDDCCSVLLEELLPLTCHEDHQTSPEPQDGQREGRAGNELTSRAARGAADGRDLLPSSASRRNIRKCWENSRHGGNSRDPHPTLWATGRCGPARLASGACPFSVHHLVEMGRVCSTRSTSRARSPRCSGSVVKKVRCGHKVVEVRGPDEQDRRVPRLPPLSGHENRAKESM